MRRRGRILPLVALLACPAVLTGTLTFAADTEPAAAEPTVVEKLLEEGEKAAVELEPEADPQPEPEADPQPEPEADPQPEPRPELSPEMAALRDTVRRALAQIAAQPYNTRDNTPDNVIQLCLAYGVDAQIRNGGPSSKSINAIGCLSWNFPCAGYQLLTTDQRHVVPRLGYALQNRPAQFLAVLAMSAVPADYEVRVDEFRGTVAHLVEFEKRNVRSGTDLSFALIGLTRYIQDEPSWQNDLQEEWSIQRLLREELARSPDRGNSDVTDRLMGLSYAVDRQVKRDLPVEDDFLTARQHIAEYQNFALSLQNPDGTWHPQFFARRGASRDTNGLLCSTGHILEWLVFSLPEDRLEDPRVVRSVSYLVQHLGKQRTRWSMTSETPQDFRALMHSAHALRIYDRRVFRPADPKEPEAKPESEASEALAYRSSPE